MEPTDRTPAPPSQTPRSNLQPPRSAWPLVLLLAVAAAAGGFWWLKLRTPPAEPVPAPAAQVETQPAPAQPVAAVEAPSLPPVAEADGRVRQALRAFSGLAPLLQTEDLARRMVAGLNAVADDESPRQSLSFLSIEGSFAVVERDGRTFIDPDCYARYDALADAFGSLDARGAAGAYRELKPLLEAAYREIGRPGTTFEGMLSRAIAKLLAVPVPEGEVELVPVKLIYGYADPALEALAPAQKQLLRMGPENARDVQRKLRELSRELGLPLAAAGAPADNALPER